MRATLPLGIHALYDRVLAPHLQRFYDRLVRNDPQAAVVDLGCGPGHLAAAIARRHPRAQVLGVDLDVRQLRRARRREAPGLSFCLGDVQALPLADGTMDRAVATEAFHHWQDPARAVAEAHRVLRPGGRLCIVETAADMTREELRAWSGLRWPGLAWAVRRVARRHGFTPERLEKELLPLLERSPFGGAQVRREDGWWIVACTA